MSFLTASQARAQAIANTVVLNEMHAIESDILTAVQSGELADTSIGGTTTMTSTVLGPGLTTAQTYYNVWKGTVTDDAKAAAMSAVVDNFSKLGYGIKRIANEETSNTTFLWYVTW